MSQWMTLLQKELVEMWRNFKWIWVPITFILIGVQEPLTSYYMPQIIDSMGGLPEGTIIKIPPPTAADVLMKGLSQYSTIGILVIVLITMGLIASERKSGVAAMILVKPVSFFSYVTAKWAGGLLLIWLSFLIGYLSTWYYTGILFDWIPISEFLQSYLFYVLWLTVILTLTLFFSASLMTSGLAGFISLAVVIVVTLIGSSFSNWLEWSPSQLSGYASAVLMGTGIPDNSLPASLIAIACIVILLSCSVFVFRKKELAA